MASPSTSESTNSPFRRRWRQLRRSKTTMIGLGTVTFMCLLIVGGPLLSQQSPTELRPWLSAMPPGSQAPDCHQENHFVMNEAPESTARVARCEILEIVTSRDRVESYRVVLRRGRVHRITQEQDATALDTLDLTPAEGEVVTELLADGEIGKRIPPVTLRKGDRPPANLFAKGQRVLFIGIKRKPERVAYTINMSQGRVTAITENGRPLDAVILKGPAIEDIKGDGRPLVQRYYLGTDDLGRDLLSRILYGGRISMMVGIVATVVSLVIGVLYGAVAGFVGGRVDRIMMSIVDILYAVPFMFVVIILLVLFGRNIIMLFVALGAVQWLTMARIVRGQVLSLKTTEFVDAARLCGAGPMTIILKHLIPNSIGPIVVFTTLTVPAVILEESFLAFIGLTVQYRGENLDSWGALVQQGMLALGADGDRAWLLLWPSLAMAITLFGLNCLGDGLRDCFDPRHQGS